MPDQTIVAVYDTPAHAELAVQDLLQAGVPPSVVERHALEGSYTGHSTTPTSGPQDGQSFWTGLFGGEPDHDIEVYGRSVSSGSTVVSARVSDDHASLVHDILESHAPVDLDERAGRYGLSTATPSDPVPAAGTNGTDHGVMTLSEESLAVGKRVVNHGTTRIRRFVVETPVQEMVSLRDEHVTVERHAVTDCRVADEAFGDKVIEMTEMAEEAVVSKIARVREEIVLRRDVTDRVETVRDTVRREDVEIVKLPGDDAAPLEPSGGRKV